MDNQLSDSYCIKEVLAKDLKVGDRVLTVSFSYGIGYAHTPIGGNIAILKVEKTIARKTDSCKSPFWSWIMQVPQVPKKFLLIYFEGNSEPAYPNDNTKYLVAIPLKNVET
jgi:hypothetical protein